MTRSYRRRGLRLKGYDYAQAGAYFVTVCVQDRSCLFGDVASDTICLSARGQLAAALWSDLPLRFPEIDLDAFVVMPNHIRGIIVLSDRPATVVAPLEGAPGTETNAPTVGDVVGAFKSLFTVKYIQGVKEGRWPRFQGRVWQRNYYEHVIRDEPDLARVRSYIDENPLRWAFDDENPLRNKS